MRKALLLASLLLATFASKGLNLLTESFDGGTFPPTGWSKTSSGTLTWTRLTAGVFPTQSPHSGAGEANFNSWYVSSGSADLITPAISFVGGSGIQVSFWMYRDNGYLSTADKVDVYANTTATSSGGTLLGTVNRASNLSPSVSSNGWYQYTFVVPSTFNTSTNYIIFKGTSQYGNDIFIDDVSVDNPVCGGTPLLPLITSPAISPSAPLCNSTTTINASDPNQPVSGISYVWQSGTSSTGPWTTITGATSLTYTTPALSTTTYYRIGAYCVNSNITSYSAPFTALTGAPQPGVISGRPTSCPGDIAIYSVPAVTGTTYNWTLPIGWTGTSTTSSITVTMGTNPGTISVTATSSCGGPSTPRTYTTLQGSAPAMPAAINGFNSICSYTTQTYSIAPVVAANSYVWTLPNGWTGTSSGPSITVNADTTSGNVTVKAVNGCGSSTVATLAVSVINSLANPGTIASSAVGGTYCSGVLYNFSITPVPGATSYQWVLPPTWSGTTSGTSIQAFAGGSGGQLKVTAYVSCATSPSSLLSTPVTTTVNPTVSITTPSALCQGVPATFTANAVNGGASPTYQWRKNGIPVFSIGNTYTDASLTTGDVLSVRLTSNATCRSTDTISSPAITANITPAVTPGISINSTPAVTICAGSTLNFTTSVTGTGTAPIYQWYVNSLPVATSQNWSSSSFNNGDTITVKLTSNAACATVNTVSSNKVGIKVNPLVVPAVTASASSTIANGQPITFTLAQTGGGTKQDYQWIKNGVDVPNGQGDTYTALDLVPGDRISVRMQSYAACANPGVVTSNEIIMGGALGIPGLSAWNGTLSLYPNPTGGRFTVAASWIGTHCAAERVTLEVLNAIGQSIYHSEVAPGSAAKGTWHYDVSLPESAPAGQYILRISAPESGMRATLPLLLNR